MEISKIKPKYCTEQKVQVMFSNAPNQIICSNEGYIYLRENDVKVHAYIFDPIRKKMPYRKKPSSDYHASHLFKYDKPYIKYTDYREMRPSGSSLWKSRETLTFLYFIKTEDRGAICAELSLNDFIEEDEQIEILSNKELMEFLYDTQEFDGKCIIKSLLGIRYAKFNNEDILIEKEFIDISDEGIIKRYNYINKFCDEVEKIEQIDKQVDLTKDHIFWDTPRLITFKGDEIYVYNFDVWYCGKNCFKMISRRRKISFKKDEILLKAKESDYTADPDFI